MARPATRLGVPVSHIHGPEKVTGRTRVAADVDLPGRLWGKLLRSPHPHARLRRMEASAAWRVPGVKAVVTGQDAPGHLMGKGLRDTPVLCWERVRSSGDVRRRRGSALAHRRRRRAAGGLRPQGRHASGGPAAP